MTETNYPKLSVEEIMDRIKKEVAKRRGENPDSDPVSEIEDNLTPSENNHEIQYNYIDAIPSRKVPFEQKEVYEYSDFTKYHDENFIINVYRGLLKREPDTEGFRHYLELLRNGEMSKPEIISLIRYSGEGRQKGVKLLGFKKRLVFYGLLRVPVLSKFVQWPYYLVRLPKLVKNIRELEAYNNLRFNEIYSDMLSLQSGVNDNDKNIADKASENLNNISDKLNTKAELSNIEEIKSEIYNKLQEKGDTEELAEITRMLSEKADYKNFDLYLKTVTYAKEYMQIVQQNMQHLIDEAKKRLPDEVFDREELQKLTEEEKHKYDAFYVEFEDKFRGSREDIKERVKVYLPYIEDLPFNKDEVEVLDVGCGRGEWLELLQENGYNAKGIDLNRVMVNQCREAGLDVEEHDVIDYLSTLSSESLNVITGFHIIEHLPFETLVKLFEESYRVLKKGGMVIFETPNPENIIVGACNFYTDPTHRNPIPPTVSEFMAKSTNFDSIEIKRLNGNFGVTFEDSFLDHQFASQLDYSVIGYKK